MEKKRYFARIVRTPLLLLFGILVVLIIRTLIGDNTTEQNTVQDSPNKEVPN